MTAQKEEFLSYSLINYNGALTKDETQKQYLLQLVSRHRKLFPEPMKAALKTIE